jgi:N-acetylglucosamine-6-phosphate deacetylase
LQTGTLVAVRDLVEPFLDVVSSVTVDPVSTDTAALEWLVANGVTVAIGHTPATYLQALDSFRAGATVLTHAFNAMLPISSREPGPVMAAIDAGAWIEVIADGHHVHPSILKNLFQLVPDKVVLVSDSISATGLRDGDYSVGTVPITMAGGIARTKDGFLAGSTLPLADAVTNVVSWGVEPAAALAAATVNPRAAYGQHLPELSVGSPADFTLWSKEMRLTHIVRGGVISPAAAQ